MQQNGRLAKLCVSKNNPHNISKCKMHKSIVWVMSSHWKLQKVHFKYPDVEKRKVPQYTQKCGMLHSTVTDLIT